MDYAQQQRNPARHLISFSLVVLLHVVLIYALINGLAHKIVEVVKKPIETKIVEEHRAPPPPEAPPPPPPKLVAPPPPPFIPPPEIQIAVAPPVQSTITQVTTKAPPPSPAQAPARPGPRTVTAPALDRSSCPTPEPQYPMASRRNQEVGTLVLRIQIDANGLPGKIEVSRSSGYSRLDESAKSWIASCRFKVATVDGKPVAGWATQAYTFNLRD
ncbi:MAG TPA: TonB family protein [Burkholderiaceae bacterium]|nr:TonB family protein [Burkholderiaceae bacterium]HYB50691.1 TonB family protein [Burkholderiaceae bacterium]